MIFAEETKFLFSRGHNLTNIKWFDIGYSNLMFFVFEGEHLTNIKRFDIEYSNLIIFAEGAKSSGALDEYQMV